MKHHRESARSRQSTNVRRTGLAMVLAGLSPLSLAQPIGDAESQPQQLQALQITGTALKVDVPLAETPRPASVVNREELDDRNVQSLDETFRYRAGVLAGHYGADNDTDWFKVRGFDQSTYQDGLRIYREGFYVWVPETFGLERVELLKGPASILYGEAPPGGVINAVSKRPGDQPGGLLELQLGNREHRQLNFDTSAALTDSARYRVVGVYKTREGDLDQTDNERYYLAPSLELDLGDATTLTLLSSIQKDNGTPVNGFKLPYGTVQDTPHGKVDPSANLGQPGYDQNQRSQVSLGYELEHQISNTWTAQQNFRYSRMEVDLRSSYALFGDADNDRQAVQGLVYRDGRTTSWTVDSRLVGRFYTDATENTLLLGVDYQHLGTNGREFDNYAFGTIDMFDPVYGNFVPATESDLLRRDIDKQQTGLYIQDQLRILDRLVVLAGARYDMAETENRNKTAGVLQKSDDEQWSLSGGLMYLSSVGLSPYLSYTESFQPLTRVDTEGELFDPREGRQLEAGLKYAPAWFDGYVSAAYFDIEETNSLVTAADGGYQVQEGERVSRGAELEANVYLTDRVQVTGGYTYTDADSRDPEAGTETRSALIPRHMASLWLEYGLGDLTIGGGARYVGESVDGDLSVPSYTVADLMARYEIDSNWRVQLNINNLADKEYVASCDYWCYYGESRSILGSLSYRW